MKLKNIGIYVILLAVFVTSCKQDRGTTEETERMEEVESIREAEIKKSEEDIQMEINSVTSNALALPELRTFVMALQAAELANFLREQSGPFTVFAPNNGAFAEVPTDDLMKKENQDKLRKILSYHVVNDDINSVKLTKLIEDNNGSYTIETSEGSELTATIEAGNVVLKDEKGNSATVTKKDIMASNGVLHVIDAVVMPEE